MTVRREQPGTRGGRPAVLVETIGLGKDFGDFSAVDDLSFRISAGEVFGFLGPNGAGKTTTIKMLTGLLAPSRGRVLIEGTDVVRDPASCKRIIGYIPDTPFLYEKLTGDEYLAFVAGLWEISTEEALDRAGPYLERFRIASVRHNLIEGYSHGMKQKLVMTAALVHDPKVLIVDEPTVGLDPASVRVLKDILRSRADRGGAVLLSTHSLGVAQSVCDRIAILHKGSLTAMGTMEQLHRQASRDGGDLESIFFTLTEEED